MDATLGGARSQLPVHSKAFAGGAQERQQQNGKRVEEQEAVAQSLFDYYSKVPQVAKYVQIGLDAAGKPVVADCERAAQKMVVIRLEL